MEFYKFQHIIHLDDFLYWIETEKYNLIDNNITKINLYGTPKLHETNSRFFNPSPYFYWSSFYHITP